MSNIINQLKILYKNQSNNHSFLSLNNYDDYSTNSFILIIIIILLFFFYIKINIQVDTKNWDIKKCNPKYLFFSGYINNNTLLSNNEATIVNFIDCTNKVAKGTNEYAVGKMLNDSMDTIKNDIINVKKDLDSKKKIRLDEIEEKQKDISAQFDELENDLSFNISKDSVYSYSLIKNIGIYIDQLNGLINYIGEYTKQILTYKMMYYVNKCLNDDECRNNNTDDNYKRAIQYKNILDMYYGGNNL